MALSDMIFELQGSVTSMDVAFARTLINEAYADVRRLGGWSFQLAETGFTVPGSLATGTVTLQFGSPTVIANAAATTAWATASQYGSLITQRQFRSGGTSGAGTMYDIVAYNPTGSGSFATLTLNRPFADPLTSLTAPVTNQAYFIYQPYIAAPVKDFRRWFTVLDIANSGSLWVRGDRRKISNMYDPQRQIFANPDRLLALGQDQRANSSTAGWQRYELWPGPQNQFLYMAWYERFGNDLVNLSDELPNGLSEAMVKSRARVRCYETAEANKNQSNPRGAGADYRFLMQAAQKEYEYERKENRKRDRDSVDMFFATLNRFGYGPAPSTINAQGNVLAQVGT
jgi:hypothetical protein